MGIIYFAYAVSKVVSGGQFLNITFLLVLVAAAPAAAVLLTVIFPLTSIYASLESHKLDLSIAFLNLICLLAFSGRVTRTTYHEKSSVVLDGTTGIT